jgi:hypothetical protein
MSTENDENENTTTNWFRQCWNNVFVNAKTWRTNDDHLENIRFVSQAGNEVFI